MTPEAVITAAIVHLGADPFSPLCGRLVRGMQNAKVQADPSVPTACIGPGDGRWDVRLGTAFCAEHVLTPQDAILVVLHELMHAADGHFELAPPADATEHHLRGILLDILVNGHVIDESLFEPPPLLRRLYDPSTFPGVLLTHPADLLAHLAERDPAAATAQSESAGSRTPRRTARLERLIARHLASLQVKRPLAVARLYLEGWYEHPDPHAYCAHGAALLGGDPRLQVREIVLLGNHDGPRPRIPGGYGLGGPDEEHAADPRAAQRQVSAFVRAVLRFLDAGANTVRVHERCDATVVPHLTRRETAAVALGLPPALYRPIQIERAPSEEGVRIYLDVSGSLFDRAGLLLALARGLGDDLARPVWGWSTRVFPVDVGTLGRVRVRTTGGTDLSCVLEHALDHRFRRVVVITDGEFPLPSSTLCAAVRRRGLRVVFVRVGWRGRPNEVAIRLGATVLDLPEVFGPLEYDLLFRCERPARPD